MKMITVLKHCTLVLGSIRRKTIYGFQSVFGNLRQTDLWRYSQLSCNKWQQYAWEQRSAIWHTLTLQIYLFQMQICLYFP